MSLNVNSKLVKRHFSYRIAEVARLFGVHDNTVRNWIGKGLPTLDVYPELIDGGELQDFLDRRRANAQSPCNPGEMYCLPCRAPKAPAGGRVDFVYMTATRGQLKARCACGTMMNLFCRVDALSTKMPNLDVQFQGGPPSLSERSELPVDCDSDAKADDDE